MPLFVTFEWSFVVDHIPDFLEGLKLTFEVSAIAIGGALAIGIVFGAARAHRIPVLSQLAAIYVELIRNTPLLVQIFFVFFGLPQIGFDGIPQLGVDLRDPFDAAWVSLTIWGGAFNIENFRAGFEAVPLRFREAGFALGFSPLSTFVNVTLPIGGRIALPSSINTYVSILKNTAVLGPALGLQELTNVAYSLESSSFKAFEIYTMLAVSYLAIVWGLSALIRALEAHLRLPEDRPARAPRQAPAGEAA
jgi:His/Glu/Gln/Arg/opine family amino acid ABC transporter permease subunit